MEYNRSAPTIELLARYTTKHGVDKQGRTTYDLSYVNQIAAAIEKFPFKQFYPYLNLTEFLFTAHGLQRVVGEDNLYDIVKTLVSAKERGKNSSQKHTYKKVPKKLKKEHILQNPYNGQSFTKRIEACLENSETGPFLTALERYANGIDFSRSKLFTSRKLISDKETEKLTKIQNTIQLYNMNQVEEEFISKTYLNLLETFLKQ